MTDTSAKILAKGCQKTGLTPSIAQQLYAGGRTTLLAIVELEVVKDHTNRVSGANTVDLAITTIEPVIDGNLNGTLDEHVRTIAAALYQNRLRTEGTDDELPLDEIDGPAPKVADIIGAESGLVERDTNGNVTGLFSNTDSKTPAPV